MGLLFSFFFVFPGSFWVCSCFCFCFCSWLCFLSRLRLWSSSASLWSSSSSVFFFFSFCSCSSFSSSWSVSAAVLWSLLSSLSSMSVDSALFWVCSSSSKVSLLFKLWWAVFFLFSFSFSFRTFFTAFLKCFSWNPAKAFLIHSFASSSSCCFRKNSCLLFRFSSFLVWASSLSFIFNSDSLFCFLSFVMSALSLASIPSFFFLHSFSLFCRSSLSLSSFSLRASEVLFLPSATSEFPFVTSVIYELPFVISLLLPFATSELPLFFSLPPLRRPTCEILLPVLPAFLFRTLTLFVDQQSWRSWPPLPSSLFPSAFYVLLPVFSPVRWILLPVSFVVLQPWWLLFFSRLPPSLLCWSLSSSFLLFPFGYWYLLLFRSPVSF